MKFQFEFDNLEKKVKAQKSPKTEFTSPEMKKKSTKPTMKKKRKRNQRKRENETISNTGCWPGARQAGVSEGVAGRTGAAVVGDALRRPVGHHLHDDGQGL